KGDVWSFAVPPETAYEPVPAEAANFVMTDTTLTWTPGFGATLHYVYFGDNLDEVSNAAGALPLTEPTFTPPTMEAEKTYYWRVDEFDSAGATHKGNVWSFTTVPDVAVTNPNLMLWWTLDEGEGTTAVDWSGHGNHGAITGDAQWTDGYQGTALTFDSDVYVESAGYQGVTGTAARTLCAWIRTSTANRTIMSWGLNLAGQKWRMYPNGTTGGLRLEVNGGYKYGVTNIADGRWHHVAVTFEDDGTPDVLDTLLYVDGQPDATADSADESIDTGTTGLVRIGESPWHNQPFVGVIDDARIYDTVLTAEDIQQVMRGNTKLAGNPVPDRNTLVDIRDVSSLSFSAGDGAASHDVYFGTDRDAVAGADNSSPEFQASQAGTSLSLDGLVEFGGGDYYWRVDEVQNDGTVVAGTIWKFTVPDYLIVDNFESYNDLEEDQEGSNRVYLTWIDGYGTATNGAVAGNLDPPFMSQGRDSAQAMPLSYDNAGKISEATRTLTSKKDWTAEGVTNLAVWFSGASGNAADRMFVALGNAVVYHSDDAATQDGGWNEWVIDLQEFANQGVDVTNVDSITLGIGTRGAPVATGGTGTVHFDDIRLIR
ncbi:MAG: LamG domain-containing protein, partial [Phycisphaerales bacterium]